MPSRRYEPGERAMLEGLPLDEIEASFPAAYCTITSVPPAIGSHAPGSLAKSESTAGKAPGAMSS